MIIKKALIDVFNDKSTFVNEKALLSDWQEHLEFDLLLELSITFEQTINLLSFIDLNHNIEVVEDFIELLYQISQNDTLDDREKLHLELMSKKFLIILADVHEQSGCVGAAFDYLVKVIDPTYDKTNKEITKVNLNLNTFLSSIELDIDDAREIFLHYCSTYFSVISVLGHALDEALDTYQISKGFARTVEAEEVDVRYWCSVSAILYRTKKHSGGVVHILKSLLKKYHEESGRFMILESLLRYNQLIGKEQAALFKEARKLKVYGSINITKKALKFWSFLLSSPASSSNLKESFIELLRYIIASYPDEVQQRLHKSRISWVVNEVIHQLLARERKYKLAFELAFRWQTNEVHPRIKIPDDHLYILSMATMELNKCWYLIKLGDDIRLNKFNSKDSYSDFISRKNKIESSWLTMLEEKASHAPVVSGNPNIHRDISEEYEHYFHSIYCMDKLIEVVNSLASFKEVHIFELSAANVPIQPFLSKSLGKNIPVSLLRASKVSRQRKFNKLLFWIDPDQGLYMAEKERDAILYMVREKGIDENNIIVRFQNECTKEEFMQLYTDPSIDLIWVSGHGTRDSNNPRKSFLKISNTEEIYLGDLANISIPGQELGKRLLVLNMCETASEYIRYNSMDFLSISSVLTSEHQSVLGHLWPTNYLTSATFGALLYLFLMKENNWSIAISNTQYVMSKGSVEIVKQFQQTYPNVNLELSERIQNQQQSIEMDIIANWGSSSYNC